MGLDSRSEGMPWYTNAPMMVSMPDGTLVATDGRFVTNFVGLLLLIILARLCWLTSWKVLAVQQSLTSFLHKQNTKNLRTHQIYVKKKMQNIVI